MIITHHIVSGRQHVLRTDPDKVVIFKAYLHFNQIICFHSEQFHDDAAADDDEKMSTNSDSILIHVIKPMS
jgi:hypothetical protein